MTGPLPDILKPVSVPASWVYGLAVARRNARFERGIDVQRIAVPVISVGNVTAGGTGKTPMVRHLVQLLLDHERQPIIAMRGYRPSRDGISDEEAEYAALLPDVEVVVGADRYVALSAHLRGLSGELGSRVVLLDDGFQHRRLHRDLNLVLIDSTRETMDDRLLPAGFLREPLRALRRADAVIVTRAEDIDHQLASAIAQQHGKPPLAWARHGWEGLTIYDGSTSPRPEPTTFLAGLKVLAALGVGNPKSIVAQLQHAGAKVAQTVPLRDHQRYTPQLLRELAARADGLEAVVMTGKDWVKVRPLLDCTQWPVPIVVPQLALEVFHGGDALADLVLSAVPD